MPLTRINNTYSVLFRFIILFLSTSFLLRCIFLGMSVSKTILTPIALLHIFGMGLIYDIGVACFFTMPYAIYLLILPQNWSKSLANKIITHLLFSIAVLIIMFSFFAEFTFWKEFESRFNFIAVDYLVYTYEVIQNINESYPLPLLIGGMLLLMLIIVGIFVKYKFFYYTFNCPTPFKKRLAVAGSIITITLLYTFCINFPAHWDPKLRIPRGQVVAAASIVSPKY